MSTQEATTPSLDFLHENAKAIIEPTYGVLLYQEQVIEMFKLVGGFTPFEADIARKSLGKKLPEVMQSLKGQFLLGAKSNGYNETDAANLFEIISKYSGYSFNASHAVSYAHIAYWTAWLKVHYPPQFYASVMNSKLESAAAKERILHHVLRDIRRKNIPLKYPDVNYSYNECTVLPSGTVVLGLGCVKNLGRPIGEAIAASRERDGQFKSIRDLFTRISSKTLQAEKVKLLVHAGALDSLIATEGLNRASVVEYIPQLAGSIKKERKTVLAGQISLFGENVLKDRIPTVRDYSEQDQLLLEKEAYGFYLKSHPLDLVETPAGALQSLRGIVASKDAPKKVAFVCFPTGVRRIKTKRGDDMAFVDAEDGDLSKISLIIFPRSYSEYAAAVGKVPGKACWLVMGKLEGGNKVILDRMEELDGEKT